MTERQNDRPTERQNERTTEQQKKNDTKERYYDTTMAEQDVQQKIDWTAERDVDEDFIVWNNLQ
jgi:hypothetical protein